MLYKPDNFQVTSSSSLWKLSPRLELRTRVGYVEFVHLLGILKARINCVLRDCCCVFNGAWQSTGHFFNNNIIWKLFKRRHQTPVFISGCAIITFSICMMGCQMIIWASVSPSESLGAVRVCGLVCTVWFFTLHHLSHWSRNVPRVYTRALLNKDVCVHRMLPMGGSMVCCWDEVLKTAKIKEKK